MQVIPLQAIPNQVINITLNNQACGIAVRQTNTGLYLSLALNGSLIISNTLCLNTVRLVRDAYLGFVGDLAWFDAQGSADPYYTGIGPRFFLTYLTPADVALST